MLISHISMIPWRLKECQESRRLGIIEREFTDNAMKLETIRLLLAKPGLDGHDRGVKIIARSLRDAGVEVIYTGLRQTTQMIIDAAIQEDVDLIGLSIHSGAHMTIVSRLLAQLEEQGLSDLKIFVGGIIPAQDIPKLMALGVHSVYGPGTSMKTIINSMRRIVEEQSSVALDSNQTEGKVSESEV